MNEEFISWPLAVRDQRIFFPILFCLIEIIPNASVRYGFFFSNQEFSCSWMSAIRRTHCDSWLGEGETSRQSTVLISLLFFCLSMQSIFSLSLCILCVDTVDGINKPRTRSDKIYPIYNSRHCKNNYLYRIFYSIPNV